MISQLGISLYPQHTALQQDQEYLELAYQYGFHRLFICLLSAEKEEEIERIQKVIQYANRLGMQTILDVAPRVLKKLRVSYDQLDFFCRLGASGIRLDLGFSGHEEAAMTYNPFGLKIEINMSQGTKYLEQILSCQPKRANLWGCHNFYPHRYTGLSYDYFLQCSRSFYERGIRTAAFIHSPSAKIGPWPVMEGLCTLEMHRDLPITVQAKHLFATGLINDVIIANAYASEQELRALSEIDRELLTFTIEINETTTEVERQLLLEETHLYRGDISDYLIRSTQSRVKYRDHPFPPHHTVAIERGYVLIDNERYGQYKGELQIALKPMPNSGKTNVVGKILPEEQFLLDCLKPWSKFRFVAKKDQ